MEPCNCNNDPNCTYCAGDGWIKPTTSSTSSSKHTATRMISKPYTKSSP